MKRKRLLCKRDLMGAGQAWPLQRSGDTLCFFRGEQLPYSPPISNSNAGHVWVPAQPLGCRCRTPRGRDPRARARAPAQSQQRPGPSSDRRPNLTPDRSSQRSGSHTPPPSDPSLPSPGVSVSYPEDECVDQEDALETSDHRFGLQPPRRGRHD